MTITLKEAKQQFSKLLNSLDKADKPQFITSVFQEVTGGHNDLDSNASGSSDELFDDPVATLNRIANELKKKVPISAILPSENISKPTSGDNADCLEDITVNVDDFLYNDEDVEELVEDGKLKRNYCKDCSSKNIEPLIFISHSMSRDALYYIFNTRLPTLENKIVLDVGSRLGAVLYGAHVYTDASQIIGVEMNEDLCKLQRDIISKYKMDDRIQVVNKKIEEAEDIVKSADVVIINNAFEFYSSEENQIKIWQFLRRHIRSKTILVTRPHLETTFKNLNCGIDIDKWVKHFDGLEVDPEPFGLALEYENSEFCDLAFYEIV